MSDRFTIRADDAAGPESMKLLEFHLSEMHRWSPACQVHALPAERLREPDVAFFSVWSGADLAAIGALKQLTETRGELKSMRAAPAFRGTGAGKAILEHLLQLAQARGYQWVGLETGRPEPFVPAQKLYEKYGFAECPPFGDYVSDEFSMCMEKHL